MYKFINKFDFNSIAVQEDLDILTDENLRIMYQCTKIAIDEASCYLNAKFDVEKIFPDVNEYISGNTYTAGELIYLDQSEYDNIYQVKEDGVITDATFSTKTIHTDTRNSKLLEVTMAIALFHMHKRLSPNNIPELRAISYDGNGDDKIMSAIKWLGLVQSGDILPYGFELKGIEDEDTDSIFEVEGNDPANGIMWGGSQHNEYAVNAYEYNPNITIKE